MIIKRIREVVLEHISDNSVKYFFLMLCLFSGIAAGAVFVTALPAVKAEEMTVAINSFCESLNQNGADWIKTFKSSLWSNLKCFLFLYVCGFWSFLIPFIYGNMVAKGFMAGFTIGFMSCFYGGRGMLFVLASVVPQCIILVPIICVMSVNAVNFALIRRKTRKNMLLRRENTKELLKYTYISLGIFAMVFLSILADTFVIPIFIKMTSGIFLKN